MALETSGFQLSQFDQAPNVPSNIGVVDTKGIYGAVVDALKTNEALRTTQLAQATTDAELGFARQKALTETELLGPEAEARRAKAELFAAEAPYQQGLIRPKAIATRTELESQAVRNRLLSDPAVARQVLEGKTLTPAVRTQMQLQALLNRGGLSEEEQAAIKAKLGQTLTVSEQAKLQANLNKVHEKVVDGQVIQFTNSGAIRIPGVTDWSFGPAVSGGFSPTVPTGGAGVLAAPAATAGGMPAAIGGVGALGAPATAGRGILAGESPAIKREAVTQQKYGQGTLLSEIPGEEAQKATIKYGNDLLTEAQKNVRVQQKNLSTFETEAKADDEAIRAIDELKDLAEQSGILVSGGAIIGKGARALLPEQRAAFKNRLVSVTQRIQLGNMLKLKNASATGSTGFGNLTESEGDLLKADWGIFSDPDLSTEQIIAGLDRAKAGMLQRREDARKTIYEELQRARSDELNGARIITNESPVAMQRLMLARHSAEPSPETAAPAQAPAEEPSSEAKAIFPAAQSMAPARLTIGAAPTPEATQSLVAGPHTEGPLESVENDENYERLDAGAPSPAASYPGRVVTPPSPAPAPAATPSDSAAPTRQYPAYSLLGAIERMPSVSEQGKIATDIAAYPGRTIDMLSRYGSAGLQGLVTGNYTVPEKGPLQTIGEKIGGALAGSSVEQERESIRRDNEILRTKPNSWEAYNIRRKMGMRQPEEPAAKETPAAEQTPAPAPAPAKEPVIKLTEEQLPQIKLSPEAAKTARQLLSQYEAAEKERNREQVTPELSAAEGGNRGSLKSSQILRQLLAVLTGGTPSVEPRLEVDREGTRRLTDERMRREEMFRTLRASPRR